MNEETAITAASTEPVAHTADASVDAGVDGRHTGRSTLRIEDHRLVTGRARYTDSVQAAGVLHLAVARSPLAHARVSRVDVSVAREQPGVVAAFTAEDLADMWTVPLPVAGPDDAFLPARWPLTSDKVRFVGDAVAVVVAESREAAVDALEFVDTDYDPLESVADLDTAVRDETLVHEEAGTNTAFEHVNDPVGDVEQAFADADVVIERRYVQQRLVATALETRATLAVPVSDGGLTLYTSTQVPSRIRDDVAEVLGMEPGQIRVDATDVGGGFGVKLEAYGEDVLCAALALRLGRPVRFTATRSEDIQTTNHGRAQIQHVKAAARADGTLLGLDVALTSDCGGYMTRNESVVILNGRQMFTGCYRWPAFAFRARAVFTTAAPIGPYRGAGRPEATFGVERMMDDLAAELGMDPAELRRHNLPTPDEFPFPSAGGFTFDSGDYAGALDVALQAVDYPQLRAEQADRRAAGDPLLLGIGLSSWLDRCGPGSEFGAVRVDGDGRVEVLTGLTPSGQGTATSLAQLTADALGIDPADVTVVAGDTGKVPQGAGTFASRSMAVGAGAVHEAAGQVADQARRIAAHLLEASPEDIEIGPDGLAVRGSPDTSVGLAEVAAAAAAGRVPDDMEPRLAAEVDYQPDGLTFPYGTHLAVVEVDRETGAVQLRRYVAVDDVGEAINPDLLDGQRQGGIAQGVAQALYEAAVYDPEGNLTTGTLVDYFAPSAADLPHFELHRTVTPSPNNPLGVKGVGEAGTIAAPPAVANAVVDALRHLGVKDVDMPCTPQRIIQAIRTAEQERS